MPREKVDPIYEAEPTIDELVIKLKEMYPDIFYAVNPAEVKGFSIVNKPRPDSKLPDATIFGASGVWAFVNPVKYVIVVYASDWTNWASNKRAIAVAKAIKRISDAGKGKLEKYDEQNHRSFLLTFGIGYEENPEVPNILEKRIDWVQ